ncbi:MAG: type I restriction endonuclease subunit R, partial [Lachnospiraceae bacterium]|nr:type I restriction endonuclease subunit R [Lachnospiraceae bacterium]
INDENERLSQIYGGNYAFVKTYQDAIEKYSADKSEIEKMLVYIYHDIKDVIAADTLIVQGRKNFAAAIKHDVTKLLLKDGVYAKIKNFYDQILSELYTNLQLFR